MFGKFSVGVGGVTIERYVLRIYCKAILRSGICVKVATTKCIMRELERSKPLYQVDHLDQIRRSCK